MADHDEDNIEDEIEDKLEKLPVIKYVIRFLKGIQLPALEGLTLYAFLRLYGKGVIRGAVTSRASAIAFSFFTAIFPFLLLFSSLISL
jgi:membrane protein